MRGLAAVVAHHESVDEIRSLRIPVLLINGAETVRFHRRINESLSALLTDVQVREIPGTHAASRTSVTPFLEATRAFLTARTERR